MDLDVRDALIGFAGVSAIGVITGSFGVLVAARTTRGARGAILAPSALTLLLTTFTDGDERADAFAERGRGRPQRRPRSANVTKSSQAAHEPIGVDCASTRTPAKCSGSSR